MADSSSKPTIVSLGGNAIVRRGERGTIDELIDNMASAARYVARIACAGSPVIVTHGNGPIVGDIVLRGEEAKGLVPPMPLYISDADSEGAVGFLIQQALYNELIRLSSPLDTVALITQVTVSPGDPAFEDPTKPIGRFYSRSEAAALRRERGWSVARDGSDGYRRVVPSPCPERVVESDIIKRLAESGTIVIAAGGGGVPVVEAPDGSLKGVEAVIDKDRTTAKLATSVGAERIITLTDVDMVYLDYGKPGQRGIAEMDINEARRYLKDGEFPPGSMGPKVESAIEFIEAAGREVIITSPELLEEALEGKKGTVIRRPD